MSTPLLNGTTAIATSVASGVYHWYFDSGLLFWARYGIVYDMTTYDYPNSHVTFSDQFNEIGSFSYGDHNYYGLGLESVFLQSGDFVYWDASILCLSGYYNPTIIF